MQRAFVFPGQGSQAVGMGKALAEAYPTARELFEEVDEALSQRLSRLMFEGPAEELTLTENAQPALMAVSVALVRVLQREGGLNLQRAGRFVAGHSDRKSVVEGKREYERLGLGGSRDIKKKNKQ